MKKFTVLLMVVAVALLAGTAQAEQRYPLGFGNVAIKVDYLRFTDSQADDLGIANAPYIGAEVYFPVWNNLYLGLESGYAWSSGSKTFTFRDFDNFDQQIDVKVDLDVDYVPIELNVKYVFPLCTSWTLDIGGGVSYNYFNIDASAQIDGGNEFFGGDSDWLFGGQFFADVNYKMGPWFFGANIKYQITEDLSFSGLDTDVSASNFRVGGQLGFMF
jgi:hypothetical protein